MSDLFDNFDCLENIKKEMTDSAKNEFIESLESTRRNGIDKVLEKLEQLGFFEAPASTRFHLNYKGGLLEHSLNVMHVALMLREQLHLEAKVSKESVIISTLLHDVNKAEIYYIEKKWQKTDGKWEEYETYNVNYEQFPFGHGEKSVIQLLRWGLELTDDEILAIRWHMGAWDLPFQSSELKANINAAKEKSPLLAIVQAADGLSSSILEITEK
ncbi:MAG: HD domain-containing protein [Bacteroidaceae bacterium]|nr:HD domain-containing protein [Bacteroidaceae bacterium]